MTKSHSSQWVMLLEATQKHSKISLIVHTSEPDEPCHTNASNILVLSLS